MHVIISEEARRDLNDIYLFAAITCEVETAQSLIHKMLDEIEFLQVAPDIGTWVKSIIERDTDWRFLVSHRRYLIFYKIVGDKTQVLRIMDGRTDWQKVLFKV